MKPDFYISVDIESSGPIPGRYSMLSLGACTVSAKKQTFYAEFKPISKAFVPEALEVAGFDLDELSKEGRDPKEAMDSFRAWVESISAGQRPVFVGFNATYDWQFVNWYLHTFCGSNPFGFGGVDIKSFYMGTSGRDWHESTSSRLPRCFQPDTPQTHNALEDALAQASIFAKMLAVAKSGRGSPS
jgi:DNA polymerase III epsilon subunit-like protein